MHTTYTITVPTFIKLLGGLKNVLTKAEAHAKEVALNEDTYVNDRLAPDMFPLKKQVQVACDNAKGAVARLTGKEAPVMEDTEESFADLQARIDKTIAFLQSVTEADFAGAEERKIEIKYFPGKYMTGTDYALEYAIPNFMFHIVTAYGIIRKNGTPIGKADFVNGMPLRDL